ARGEIQDHRGAATVYRLPERARQQHSRDFQRIRLDSNGHEWGWNGYVTVPGNSNPKLANQLVEVNYITPEYFKTFGIPLIEGRIFNAQDMQQTMDLNEKFIALSQAAEKDKTQLKMPSGLSFPVVINQAMVKLFWPHQDPLGKSYTGAGDKVERIVIGVVGDEKQESVRESAAPENYAPVTMQLDPTGLGVIISVKTKVAPAS